MIFDSNILTTVPADWTIINGTINSSTMTLNAGGSAKCSISLEKLAKIPEYLQVSIVSNKYADPYAANIFVNIQAVMEDGTSDTYNVPVVNTSNNTCLVQIPTTAVEHKYLYFTIKSAQAITLTDWNLYPLKQSDVDLTEVLDKIPRLLKDYNEDIINVDQIETVVAMICSYVTADTELTGDFTLTFKATQATQLVVRVYDNEVEELYAPMIFYINQGYGTIGIPHAYLSKLKGYHNFTISVQVLAGSIAVQTRRVMYVIDGGRLVYSLMDVGSVVSDLALRKLISENNYSFIYAVCLDDGICIVKKCPYSDTPGAAWIADATLGSAIDATIEFDGIWNIHSIPYSFNTEEFPWVAWVTLDNALNAKKLNVENFTTIATNVAKVHAVRGWNNLYTPGNDQGLLLAYIKLDGKAYYRSYCQQTDGTFTWETEQIISAFAGTALDVNTFRTNDFRIGINVLDNSGVTHTYLTTRNWAGMSVSPAAISVGVNVEIAVVQINTREAYETENIGVTFQPVLFAGFIGPENAYTSIQNIDDGTGNYGVVVLCTVQYRMTNLSINDFTLVDTMGEVYACTSIVETSLVHYRLTFSDFNGADHDGASVALVCSGTNTLNGAGLDLDSFSGSFVPVGLVHPIIPPPEVKELWNE